jgi:hypothetical protein
LPEALLALEAAQLILVVQAVAELAALLLVDRRLVQVAISPVAPVYFLLFWEPDTILLVAVDLEHLML